MSPKALIKLIEIHNGQYGQDVRLSDISELVSLNLITLGCGDTIGRSHITNAGNDILRSVYDAAKMNIPIVAPYIPKEI